MKKNLYLIPIMLLVALTSCGDKDKPEPNTPDPVALFNAPAEIAKGSAHTFVNNSTDAESFAWTVTPSTGVTIANAQAKDAVITFNQEGDHEVKLEAKKTGKPSSILKKTVKITANPVADFNFTFEDIDIVPAKVILNATGSANATSFEWTIANDTRTFNVPAWEVPLTIAGDYLVKLVAIKDGKRSTPVEKTIRVFAGPDFTVTKDPNFSPAKITLTNTSVAANFDSFQWGFQTASTAFQSPLTKYFYEQGNQPISLIAKKGTATRTITKQVDCSDLKLAAFYNFPSAVDLLNDFSGSNLHGFTAVPTPGTFGNLFLTTDRANSQTAVFFDGSDDQFSIPQHSLTNIFLENSNKKISVSLWVRFSDGLDQSGVLLGSFNDGAGDSYTPILYYSAGDATIYGQWPSGAIPSSMASSIKIQSPDTWYHIVLTADNNIAGGTQVLYINGVEASKLENTPVYFSEGLHSQHNTSVGFGNFTSYPPVGISGNGYFNGIMDDIRIYKKSLSLAEVQALKNQ